MRVRCARLLDEAFDTAFVVPLEPLVPGLRDDPEPLAQLGERLVAPLSANVT